jgi:hypothetical protein
MKRGEGSPAARRPGGEPPTAGDGWCVSFRRLGGWERAAGRRVSSLASAHWRRRAIPAPDFFIPRFLSFYFCSSETNNTVHICAGCGRVFPQLLPPAEVPSRSRHFTQPSYSSHLATCDPKREEPPFTPGANNTPQSRPKVCRRYGYLGTQIGLGWGRQNERDRSMVKDPPIDFEEVVVGIRPLGSIPRPVGKPRDGSSSLWSPSKLRVRWGKFRSNQFVTIIMV